MNTDPFNRQWVTQIGRKTASKDKIKSFSVASYNILTDGVVLSNSNYDYVPEQHRYMRSRHPRIMQEVRALQPDVICLQEVQQAHFENILKPDMTKLGYTGVLFRRRDDCSPATFYSTNRFQLMDQKAVIFADVLFEHLEKLSLSASKNHAMSERLDLPHNFGLVKLRLHETEREIVIGNIHTYWGPELKFPATVTLQVCAAINELQKFARNSGHTILCGDFNSPPRFPPYKLLDKSLLDDEVLTECRHENSLSVSGEEKVDLIDVMESYWRNTKPHLKSAYKEIRGEEPSITDADASEGLFTDCLDYIWFNPATLRAEGVLEPPTEESMLQHVALPSATFPSDHICLMAEFSFL